MSDDAPRTVVKPSPIHGNGLFAREKIKVGEIVCNYANISWFQIKEFGQLSQQQLDRCEWLGLNQDMCLVPIRRLKFFSANHSKTPNCLWVRDCHVLAALRDIEIDEEITYDYTLDVKPKNWIKPEWTK